MTEEKNKIVAKYRIIGDPNNSETSNEKLGLILQSTCTYVADVYNSARSLSSRVFHKDGTTLNYFNRRDDFQLEVYGEATARESVIDMLQQLAKIKLKNID